MLVAVLLCGANQIEDFIDIQSIVLDGGTQVPPHKILLVLGGNSYILCSFMSAEEIGDLFSRAEVFDKAQGLVQFLVSCH